MKFHHGAFVAQVQEGNRYIEVRQAVEHDGSIAYRIEIRQGLKILWEGDVLEAFEFLRLAQSCKDLIERLATKDYFVAANANDLYWRCRDLGYYASPEEYEPEDDGVPIWGE